MQQNDGYVWPTEQHVLNKLSKWQDLKFGVLLHWGLYSVSYRGELEHLR